MYKFRIRFELACNTYEDEIQAPSTEAARKLFAARYPEARIININRI